MLSPKGKVYYLVALQLVFGVSNGNWSGFIQNITQGCSTQRKDQISFLPIIDLNPSDENCFYFTLLYVCNQANKLRVKVPSVTFNQPLWQKPVGIIGEVNIRIVCRLVGFHIIMGFLGSIGNLMKRSGISGISLKYIQKTLSIMLSQGRLFQGTCAHISSQKQYCNTSTGTGF